MPHRCEVALQRTGTETGNDDERIGLDEFYRVAAVDEHEPDWAVAGRPDSARWAAALLSVWISIKHAI